MNRRRPWRSLAAWVLVLLGSSAVMSCHRRRYSLWTSPAVRPEHVPPEGWDSAHLAVSYHPGRRSDGGVEVHVPYVELALVLGRGADQNTWILAQANDVSGDEQLRFRALDTGRYALRFAPYGQSLELSRDQGATWSYVGLDTGGSPFVPFYCSHTALASSAPWPETQRIALEVLASTQPGTPANRSHGFDAHDPAWESELRSSVAFACGRRDNAALCAAVVRAASSPRFHFSGAAPVQLDACVADCTRRAGG